jgi:hypothetical protein
MIENDGLQALGTPHKVRYGDITAITVGGMRLTGDVSQFPAAPMEIHHSEGRLVIPASMSVPPSDLARFLLSKTPHEPSRPVHALLAEYFAEQWAKFGPEKIHVIHARELLGASWRRRARRWLTLAILLTGITWIALAVALGPRAKDADLYGAWLAIGCAAVLAAFPIHLALKSSRADSQVAKFPHACIVIGPAGLAMVQGPIQGAIRWDEITKVTTRISQWLRASRTSGLQILVHGGEILVLDIYERSPAELERLIRGNLERGPA